MLRHPAAGVLLVAHLAGCRVEGPPAAPPPPASRVTESSDAWVTRTFHVQARPARVLVVDASGKGPPTVRAGPVDLGARHAVSGGSGGDELPVAQVFRTLQEAADAAHGGDLVAVMPGAYAGFVAGDTPDAGDGRYVHWKAMGAPGGVVIDRASPGDPRWMILLRGAHHVIVEGFDLAGAATPGDMKATGPWAGIMLDGDFRRSGRLSHHVAVIGNFSHNHVLWGLHAVDTRAVLIEDNLFARSAKEHSAYVSDGSDDYVIRRNVFFGSFASGLQVNLDPEASLRKVALHPALRGYPPYRPDRAWAEGLLAAATARFGAQGFPDGRGEGFIIEENVVNENGLRGGGSLNLAGLSRSLVQNNLIYGNKNHGIAGWDNANPFDAASVDAPPVGPGEATDARLPLFGCQDDLFRNNTVLMANPERAAMQCHHGSVGCRMVNNVFLNDGGPSIQVDPSSVRGLAAFANVLGTWTDDGMAPALHAAAAHLPDAGGNVLGVTLARLGREMVRPGEAPWVLIEGGWWRLNPGRPDFRPRAGSALLAGKGDPREMPARDLEGVARAGADIGALGAH